MPPKYWTNFVARWWHSLKLWLTLRVHGRKAYEELIDRQLRLARDFVGWVEGSNDFELAVPQNCGLPGLGNQTMH